jgi:two-component system NtrC family sensor kinase
LGIALSTAALIDADVVELIYRTETNTISFPEEFELVREQLDRVRVSNGLSQGENPIYIMRPAHDYPSSGQLEFVVMPDRDDSGRFFVGNLYPAEEHNRWALQGDPAASGVYSDAEGVWISASAPLYDSRADLVGLVQVDHHIDYFYTLAWDRTVDILRGALLAIAAGIALSVLFARGMVRPLRIIAESVHAIGEGDLDRRIDFERNDEIGDVAADINRMTRSLSSAQEEAATAIRALVTSGRLASVGQLAAGVAHEINNPLTYVRTNLSMLEQFCSQLEGSDGKTSVQVRAPDLSEGIEMMREALEGVDRALSIVQDIKGFAHAGTGLRDFVDMNSVVENAMRVAELQVASDVSLECECGDIPRVLCAGQELKQVLLNLLLNASQAVGSAGTIRVSTELDGNQVVVRVSDDGPGIPTEVQERLFDPFFTTKPVGEGTGLGLSISYEIVRRHHGEIDVNSEPGQGAEFSVRLPTTTEFL